MMSHRYVLITPCRNEAEYARRTLDSVIQQSIRPALWVIVDDGSTDETPAILEEYGSRHDFIRIVRREDRGKRAVGPGVIDAFYTGLDTVDLTEFNFLCKLDLDLSLPSGYFEILMERMLQNPRLGTCSGKPYYTDAHTGLLTSERCGDEMSVGMTKFYRVECFRRMGGFVREVMWDGIDCHRCRMLGWIACSWDEPELRFVHLRQMGSSQQSLLTGRLRWGFGQYFMGTGLAYITASACFRMKERPFVLGGASLWWGYVRAFLRRIPRYHDRDFRDFLHRYHWRCLRHGKHRATEITDAEQASIFNAEKAC
jgi:poly-beta-1,6-N-acetyl-D-glucosamine synthase